MMRYQPIYTEKTACRDCYKCVRVCPVKAIRVENGSAVVVHELCIFCGKCVDICPVHAKKIRNDVPRVKRILKDREEVYASLAPSFITEFPGKEQQLLQALKLLGFSGVSETSLGAEIICDEVDGMLTKTPGHPLISSACPTVVEAVRKYHPELLPMITNLHSPLGAHAMMLRELYGESIGVVFIGPCISKKLEADRHPGLPDAAITFRELIGWMKESGIDLEDEHTLQRRSSEFSDPMSAWFDTPQETSPEPAEFVPWTAGRTTSFALENGMIASMSAGDVDLQDTSASISGILDVLESLDGIINEDMRELPRFFELLSCRGGCINGPGCTRSLSPVLKKAVNSRYARERNLQSVPRSALSVSSGLGCTFSAAERPEALLAEIPGREIDKALVTLGKTDEKDLLDCGGCGYNSCRDFAAAYLQGMAEPEMCVTKMRKQAQSKIDMLLRTLPMGVVIVDRKFTIVDCNAQFLTMFSDVSYEADDRELRKLSGLPLKRFVALEMHLQELFAGESSVTQKSIPIGDRIFAVTCFSIDQRRLAGTLFQDVTTEQRNRDAVMKRAEAVIGKNLESVQRIASLLGENAAETEIMLSSLIDVFEQKTERYQER